MVAFPFLWAVQNGGYGWSEAARAAAADRALAPEQTGEQPSEDVIAAAQVFNALHGRRGLFLTLAQTLPGERDIAYFLYRFGMSGAGRKLPESSTVAEVVKQVSGPGSSIGQWIEHRWEMSRLVELWTALGADDRIALHRHIRWRKLNGSGRVEYDSRPDMDLPGWRPRPVHKEVIASDTVRPEWFRLFKENDVILPAFVYIQAKINAGLAGEVTTAALYDFKQKRLRLYDVPRTFVAALWLQFGQAVDADKKYRQCVVCQAWFEASPETGRSSRKFCSNACRSRLYRERQEAARRLHGEGRAPREIAQELGATVETVRGWIGTGRN
jgi:hypothetical protein